jgi:hypothetical protein
MKTYLVVWFRSEGSTPLEVTQRLLSLGFRPVKGNYDYVYEWDKNATVDDLVKFADKVHLTLKGLDVLFRLETVGGSE